MPSGYTLKLKKIIESYEDPLLGSLIMSATGNSIDAGVSLDVDIDYIVKNAVENGFAYSNYNIFKEKLKSGSTVLIVADNAGEAVFDMLLIEELMNFEVDIVYAVRDIPVLNDVTVAEAREIGIPQKARLISSGCDTPGCVLARASQEFVNLFFSADIVISKGQGNLEGLSDEKKAYILFTKSQVQHSCQYARG